jgi:hypothetical protein
MMVGLEVGVDEGIITLVFAASAQSPKNERKDRRKAPKIYTTHSSHERFVFSSRSRTARLSFQCLGLNDQQIVNTERGRRGTHSWTVTMCCSHLKSPLSLHTRVLSMPI